MTVRTIALITIPMVVLAMAGCSSSELKQANGLIAEMLLTDEGAILDESKKTNFTYILSEDGETAEVTWSSGPLKNTTRTFVRVDDVNGLAVYELVSGTEEGELLVGNFDYSGFAMGEVRPNGSDDAVLGLTHVGLAPTDIPTSGILTYGGVTIGVLANTGPGGDVADPFEGDVSILANFGTGAVTGTFSGLQADGAGNLSDITFAGQMSNGIATYASTSVAVGGVGATGNVLGGFYGPGAVETSGVYDISGGTPNPIRAVGGYVASSAP